MKRVLVADDTNNIRMLLSACLHADGYDVVAAANGDVAQTLLLTEPFDLAFIDVKMPLISGTQVLRNIREKGITTPVIIITAFATVKNAIDCTRFGAAAYLQKPFTSSKVKSVIAELNASLSSPAATQQNTAAIFTCDQDFTAVLHNLLMRLPTESEDADLYKKIGETYSALGQEEKAKRFLRCADVFKEQSES